MENISKTAKIGQNLILGKQSVIKDNVIIGNNVVIGEQVILGNNVTIQDNITIGNNSKVWDNSYIRSNIGNGCIIARGVYVDADVPIGDNVKIQNRNNITHGVTLEDGVFVGPNVTFSNDKYPRAINPNGTLKSGDDWICVRTLVKKGAALGAGCVIVCGIEIGEWAMVGAGAVVTKDVPNHAMVVGNPAKIVGWVSKSGYPMSFLRLEGEFAIFYCAKENIANKIRIIDYEKDRSLEL